MKFTLDWLQSYIDIDGLSPDELAEHLTMLGLEVDSVTPLFTDLAALKTGRVISTEQHPNGDKLTICQVQVGEDIYQIVCGAPNVRKELAVSVALPGTVLPGDFKIAKSKIRGVESFGMICSERELGLSSEHDGIMELPVTTEHGQSFVKALGLDDICVEVDLTPNRPDCASVIGIGREIAAIVKKPLKVPVQNSTIHTSSKEFAVDIAAPDHCPRYAGRLIRNVKIGPSPWWLRKRLLSVGLRPINNVVDITNFVMLEYGQPLHAFDFDNLAGDKIVVRTPRIDEMTFSTLDGTERRLDPDMLMICDGEKTVAVAGVMGGLNSEVTDQTTNILLESACFNPVSIRKTARKLNLATDASYRFERGVDPEGTINALNRAVELICELGGGYCPDEGIDCYPGRKTQITLAMNIARANSLLGLDLSGEEIAAMLESIEIRCTVTGDGNLKVTPPSFRVDLEREADLVEEVARLYGYNNIPTTLPKVELSYPEQDINRLRRIALAKRLTSIGYTEAINYSFIAEKHTAMLAIAEDDLRRQSVKLLNPLSEDQAVMRTMLLPGLLENAKRNINFQKTAVKLFEIGKIFIPAGDNVQPREKTRLTGLLSGNRHGESSFLHFKQQPVDIFDAKGTVEFIIQEMSLGKIGDPQGLHFAVPDEDQREPFAQTGFSLNLFYKDQHIGSLGKLKMEILRNFSIKHEVYFFDLDYDGICTLNTTRKEFSSLPVYPSVKRDIALVVDENIAAGELLLAVQESREKLLESCELFDVFHGGKIPQGYKSIALSITYRSQSKTLTEKNVEKCHSKIVRLLTDKFGGSFRDA